MFKLLSIVSATIALTVLTSVAVRAEESNAFVARNAKIDAEYHEHAKALANDAVNRQQNVAPTETIKTDNSKHS
ncbi:hypothetical protein D3C87_1797410 [compost metagenome]